MGTSSPPQKWQSPPIFGPYLLWPNGSMRQDATWYGDRPQPRRRCVRWGPSPLPQKGRSPTQFSAHVYCGRTAAWIKMPLGTEVDLGLCDIVFNVDPATPRKKGHTHPHTFLAHVYCGHSRPSQLLLNSCCDFVRTLHIVIGLFKFKFKF